MDVEGYLTSLEAIAKKRPIDRARFQRAVLAFFNEHGRSFPWRMTRNPYAVLVSEVMLQQTQTDRVLPKYRLFLKRFPSCRALASAALEDVLVAWEGLGYYRRAKNLHKAAQEIQNRFGGRIPRTVEKLRTLPGVGDYTAAAVGAFAFAEATPLIETNLRTVFLHLFYPERTDVADAQLVALIQSTMYQRDIRRWYYALMDLGVAIKQHRGNPNTRSKHHRLQSAYGGSKRQARARILRYLLTVREASVSQIREAVTLNQEHFQAALEELIKEGFVSKGRRGKFLVRAV